MRTVIIILIAFVYSVFCQAQNTLFEKLGNKITYTVDKSGGGDFITVNDAIDAVPDNSSKRTVIFIKKGLYFEKIYIPSTKKNLVIIGEHIDSTIISYNDYSKKIKEITPTDTIYFGTFDSETFRVDADDFWLMNITLENSSYDDPEGEVSQAPALHTKGDRQVYLHCNLWGFQDTYYSGGQDRIYFKDCLINGTVDYIFGEATVLFDSCQIHTLRNGGYLTAAKTTPGRKFGYVFRNCRLTAPSIKTNSYLGRPWGADALTVFMNCYEGPCINILGWKDWGGREETCFYAEYQCYGPGSDTTKRVDFGHQLTDIQATEYTTQNIYSSYNTTYFSSPWLPNVDEDTIYSVIKENVVRFLDPVNLNTDLSGIKYSGTDLEGFHPDSTFFTIELPKGTTDIPDIEASPVSSSSTVTITYPDQLSGYASVEVVAIYEGNFTRYDIYFSVDSAYSSADADSILFGNKKVAIPDFNPDITDYSIDVPIEYTKFMSVYVYKKASDAKSKITRPPALPGTFQITITAVDGIHEKTYNVYVNNITSIKGLNKPVGNYYFKNPISDQINLNVEANSPENALFSLYNSLGELVIKKYLNIGAGSNNINFSSKNLISGIYLYQFEINGNIYKGKLIK